MKLRNFAFINEYNDTGRYSHVHTGYVAKNGVKSRFQKKVKHECEYWKFDRAAWYNTEKSKGAVSMKTTNAETIMETIYSDVIMDSTKQMLDLLEEIPDTDKPVTEDQWAVFVVRVIEIVMANSVKATINHLNFQNTRYELECDNDDLYS